MLLSADLNFLIFIVRSKIYILCIINALYRLLDYSSSCYCIFVSFIFFGLGEILNFFSISIECMILLFFSLNLSLFQNWFTCICFYLPHFLCQSRFFPTAYSYICMSVWVFYMQFLFCFIAALSSFKFDGPEAVRPVLRPFVNIFVFQSSSFCFLQSSNKTCVIVIIHYRKCQMK